MKHERSAADTAPPRAGATNLRINNRTPLARATGRIALNCDHCGLSFMRFACHVRGAHAYCGRGCQAAARVHHIKTRCVECGTQFESTASNLPRVVTCSDACWSVHLAKSRNAAHKAVNSAAYARGYADGFAAGLAAPHTEKEK